MEYSSISFLIKPSSSRCNMNCNYCFYNDITKNRTVADYGFMTSETAENIVKKARLFAHNKPVLFAFQGGEPTLVGLSFYIEFVKLVDKYFESRVNINFALQTNGLLIDKKWAVFFMRINF